MAARAEQDRVRIVTFLRDIIRIPSLSGQEEAVVRRIAAEMQSLDVFDEIGFDALGNVVGRWGTGPLTIMFDAHVDVVDTGDRARWEHDPFAAEMDGGHIYGRGATDEKPAIACMTYALTLLPRALRDTVTVYVVGSVLEEDCDGYPLRHLIEHEGLRPDCVILGEPTDLNVYRGQRGRMEITMGINGIAAHGAHCDRGDNAIYRMAAVVREIQELHSHLPYDRLLGKGSITASRIESTSPSLCSVADTCTLYLDRRLTRGETADSALKQLAELPGARAHNARVAVRRYTGTSWTGLPVEQEAYFPAWVLDDDHPLVQAAMAAAGEVNPTPPRLGVWTFSTNGVATMGRHGIPTIGYAPGREQDAHTVHESVHVDDLITATRFYARVVERLSASDTIHNHPR